MGNAKNKLMRRAGYLFILSALFAVSGCAALQGGADYEITYTLPDGGVIRAKARVTNESESVRASFSRDREGVKSITFEKIGTEQGQAKLIELLSQQTQMLQERLP